MKTISAPDLHVPDARIHPEWHRRAIASLTTLAETVERVRPALVTLPGDLYEGGIQNSEAAGFPAFIALIRRILNVCPIAAVSGTPSHDAPGAYKALAALDGKYDFVLLQPGRAYAIDSDNLFDCDSLPDRSHSNLLVFGLPEPSREWLLAKETNGSDATEALKTHLRAILLGYGAIRAEYPDVPCVFLFHGVVAGATMQNGQTVGATEIQVGREDLQLIADDITARYGGNAYPKDFGELGQVGFDIVDLQPGDTFGSLGHIHLAQDVVKGRELEIKRVDYPHPPRRKIVVGPGEGLDVNAIKGFQTWLVIKAQKENGHDPDEWLKGMIADGALPGSRVTIETVAEETVRAPEIAEKHGLVEKLEVYAEASGETLTESVKTKARQLEKESEEKGELQRTNIIVQSLKLRGAKGIYKGRRLLRRLLNLPDLPLDDLELNFDEYEQGIIGLIGPTGSGKTTILSFLAPFSETPDRKGALRDYFRLRDSSWELTFSDEYSGRNYRVLIEIDGANKEGKTSYHFFVDGDPINSGEKLSKDSYDHEMLRLFGSPELFVRCSRIAQKTSKKNPDLSEATEGERKAIVLELAGIGYLQADSENAREKAKAGEAQLSLERERITLIESQLTALPGLVSDVDAKRSAHSAASDKLVELESHGKKLAAEAEALAEKVRAQRSLTERIAGLKDQAAQKERAVLEANGEIEGFLAAQKKQPEAQASVERYEKLKAKEGAENERIAKISKQRENLTAEHGRAQAAHSDACRALEASKSSLRTEKATLEGNCNVLQAKIDYLAGNLKEPLLPFDGTCFNCGKPLDGEQLDVEKKKHIKKANERAAAEKNLTELRENKQRLEGRVQKIDTELAAIVLPDPPFPPELPPIDEAELQSIKTAVAEIAIDQARKTLAAVQEAATRIEEAKKRQNEAARELVRLQEQLNTAEGELDTTIQGQHEEAREKLEAARVEYQEAAKASAALEQQIKDIEQHILELKKQEHDLGNRKIALEEKACDAAEWRWLEKGCGPDGVQALELDAFKPAIEQTANNLLSTIFGSRFAIEISTTRTAGRGSKTHQAESFDIWIIDNEDGGSKQDFFTLSGGESVPVRLAIYEAFSRIRTQKFSPMILDEADGQLDPSLRAGYVAMIEQARVEAKRRNTIVISHDINVQEMIPQKIVMSELATEQAHVAVA